MTDTLTKDEYRIYVASLCDYNNGILHGAWIDCVDNDADEIQERVNAMLAASPTGNSDFYKQYGMKAEEWAIHDSEGFGRLIGECADFETCHALAVALEEHGGALLAFIRYGYQSAPLDALDDFEEAYMGEWSSEQEYAENLADDCGYTGEMQASENPLANYIDWEAWTHDLFIDDYWSDDCAGGVYVFRNI